MKILLADPNRDIGETFRMAMAYLGHSVTVAHCADDAMTIALHESYDGYLFDWHLPEIDGFAFLQRLRAAQPPGPRARAVCWAASFPPRMPAIGSDSFDSYLMKPASLEQVISAFEVGTSSACAIHFDKPGYHFDSQKTTSRARDVLKISSSFEAFPAS